VGSWGTGLYSGDFALDLRTKIRAVARLPFDPERLVEILCESESPAANNLENDDYTTFWLVVADQFARRGFASVRARETALRIIDQGDDVVAQQKLGRSAAGLAKRSRVLEEVRERIGASQSGARKRSIIRKPEPFLMDVGEALLYPLCHGKCRNAYIAKREKQIVGPVDARVPWTPNGWGVAIIAERGRAFDFFAWYRPFVLSRVLRNKPNLIALSDEQWRLTLPGNCPPIHFRRLEFEHLGVFDVSVERVHAAFPRLLSGDSSAIGDISICNRLSISVAPGRIFQERYVRLSDVTSR
jgi:hypothetical protein